MPLPLPSHISRWRRSRQARRSAMAPCAGSLFVAVGALLVLGCADAGETSSSTSASARLRPDDGAVLAPAWLLGVAGTGTWTDSAREEIVYAWVDARVANVRFHKRVLVETLAPYEDGIDQRLLLPAVYRGPLGLEERWGTDAIEIYPEGGPGGRALAGPVMFRLRVQHDLEGDGVDEMVVTEWQRLYGEGPVRLPAADPWAPGLTSPVDTLADAAEGTAGSDAATSAAVQPAILFAPHDDPGVWTISEIDRVIAAHRAEPGRRHTLHAAVFNINDHGIIDSLIEAHRAGVEVRLLFDGRKLRPGYRWHFGDDRLLEAGVPLLGVRRVASGAMHDKFALYDGHLLSTGSANWEWGARFVNHEGVLFTSRRELIAAYARRFEALAGGPLAPRAFAHDPEGEVSVSFAPDERSAEIVGSLIDEARESVYVAMFTAKDVPYGDTSLLRRLIQARWRGLDVILLVDRDIHEASEYFGRRYADDPTDEWVEDQGVRVVRVDNTRDRYASMHHKFVVIDGEIAVTGAFNWYYDAAYRNDEDQLVWRDRRVAARYLAEFVDLLNEYDPAFDPRAWPEVELAVSHLHERTRFGDRVLLVGGHPALGNWDPEAGLELSPANWPRWTVSAAFPAGIRIPYKYVLCDAAGAFHWERGENRTLHLPVGIPPAPLETSRR